MRERACSPEGEPAGVHLLAVISSEFPGWIPTEDVRGCCHVWANRYKHINRGCLSMVGLQMTYFMALLLCIFQFSAMNIMI